MSPETIQLDGQQVDYQLKRSSRRTIGFVVSEAGLAVTAPRHVSRREVEAALHRKSGWILKKLAKWAERPSAPELEFVDGERLPWLGGERELRVQREGVRTRVVESGNAIEVRVDPELSGDLLKTTVRNGLVRFYKREGLKLMQPLTEQHARFFRREVRKVIVREQKSRWGSCASDATIRLNWRLMGFPHDVINYVCSHEAAHLVHANHSRAFWETVEKACPDWRIQREYLKTNSYVHVYF